MQTNLKLSIRSIRKNSVHSIISIVGLGIGLGSVLLLALLYIHNKSFDRFIPDYKNAYRIILGNIATTPYPLAEVLKDENPMVDEVFRFYQKDVEIKKEPGAIVAEPYFAFADPSIFDILGIKFKLGLPAKTVTEIAISDKMARKYFPNNNAVGEKLMLRLNEAIIPLTVCGVYSNFPSNSTLSPEFVANIDLSFEAMGFLDKVLGDYASSNLKFKSWDNPNFYTYVKLLPDAKPDEISQFMDKYKVLMKNENFRNMDFSLQPVKDIYLKSDNLEGTLFSHHGNAKDLYYYLAIAFLILLIAMMNYIFLTRAKTELRLKELGSQKALGASNAVLGRQMILESNLIVFLSLIPALLVIDLAIPFVNLTMNQTLALKAILNWKTVLSFIGIALVTGTLSGLFIAGRIIRISPILLLKGRKSNAQISSGWNSAALGSHFFIFIVLISCVFALHKQLRFALSSINGINPENVLVFELNSNELSRQYQFLDNEVQKIPGVLACAGSSVVPPFNSNVTVSLLNSDGEISAFDGLIVGKGLIELLEIELMDGQSFGDYNSGNRSIIFNETAARKNNVKAGDFFAGYRVNAIVKDFHAHSFRERIQPTIIMPQNPQKMQLFVVKTDGLNNASILKSVDAMFKTITPDKIVNSYLLTDQIKQFYTRERNQTKIISAFSMLAIVLSVMGLWGMTVVSINRKTKEIGIRKVNGATVLEILMMLNLEIIKWVLAAFILAMPVAYIIMHKWLENFAYKTDLNWWIFAFAGFLAVAIALITVSWQSWKAATKNPIEALRYE